VKVSEKLLGFDDEVPEHARNGLDARAVIHFHAHTVGEYLGLGLDLREGSGVNQNRVPYGHSLSENRHTPDDSGFRVNLTFGYR
jgi:hypothetical protein